MPLNGLYPPFLTVNDPINVVNGEITVINGCGSALSGREKVILVADVGGRLTILGVDLALAMAATAMRARLVTRSNEDVTGWIDIFDEADGNNWATNDIVATFSAQNLSNAPDANQYRLTLEVTTPTSPYGFSSRDVICVDHPC